MSQNGQTHFKVIFKVCLTILGHALRVKCCHDSRLKDLLSEQNERRTLTVLTIMAQVIRN